MKNQKNERKWRISNYSRGAGDWRYSGWYNSAADACAAVNPNLKPFMLKGDQCSI